MSKWTSVIDRYATGDVAGINSPYELAMSDTKQLVSDPTSGVPMSHSLKLPTTTFTGSVYREPMCLIQTAPPRNLNTGSLCVSAQKFLAVNDVDGYFDTTGIVGLGPQREFDDESIVS